MKSAVLILAALLLWPTALSAEKISYDTSDLNYVISYEKPVLDGYPAMLHVVFYGSTKPTPEQAQELLIGQMKWARTLDPQKHDILGTVWHSATGKEIDEESVLLPCGSTNMVLEKKDAEPKAL